MNAQHIRGERPCGGLHFQCACSSEVEHSADNRVVVGSIPTVRTNFCSSLLTGKKVGRLPTNWGSSPQGSTNFQCSRHLASRSIRGDGAIFTDRFAVGRCSGVPINARFI